MSFQDQTYFENSEKLDKSIAKLILIDTCHFLYIVATIPLFLIILYVNFYYLYAS